MDGSIALAVRRAKRSKAKDLDLSCRGLQAWPPDIYDLVQLMSLDLSNNELANVPTELSRLENLSSLNLSNNKIDKLPEINFASMPKLGSIVLEGNPVAKSLPSTTVRKLAQPNTAQELRELLSSASGGASSGSSEVKSHTAPQSLAGASDDFQHRPFAPAAPINNSVPSFASSVAPTNNAGTSVTNFSGPAGLSDSDSDGPIAPPRPAAGRTAAATSGTLGTLPGRDASALSGNPLASSGGYSFGGSRGAARPSSGESAGRSDGRPNHSRGLDVLGGKDETDMALENARLQAEIKDLKAQLASSGRAGDSVSKSSLSSTLPSRLHTFDDNEDSGKLKQQLQEEQRKAKRLERDNQKLQERMRESSMAQGGGSAPHFEMSEVEEGEVLSKSGGFSVIYHGSWHGTPVAMKKLFDPSNSAENLAEFDNEVQKLEKLRHPNILLLLGVHRKPPALCILMEIVSGGSLYQLLHTPNSFNCAPGTMLPVPITEMITIDEATALGLAFLHARGISHRDVKPHNVLLSPYLEVKICDFGLARMKSELMTGAMQFAGTPQYMAPEVLQQLKYTEKVDVFAYGTLLWECMAGDIPFANLDVPEIRELCYSGKMLQMPRDTPPAVQAIIRACWTVDQNTRPTMAHVLGQVRAILA